MSFSLYYVATQYERIYNELYEWLVAQAVN